jgi:hypothetical protein
MRLVALFALLMAVFVAWTVDLNDDVGFRWYPNSSGSNKSAGSISS